FGIRWFLAIIGGERMSPGPALVVVAVGPGAVAAHDHRIDLAGKIAGEPLRVRLETEPDAAWHPPKTGGGMYVAGGRQPAPVRDARRHQPGKDALSVG